MDRALEEWEVWLKAADIAEAHGARFAAIQIRHMSGTSKVMARIRELREVIKKLSEGMCPYCKKERATEQVSSDSILQEEVWKCTNCQMTWLVQLPPESGSTE